MKYILDYIVIFFSFLGDFFVAIGKVVLQFFSIVVKAGDFLFSIVGALPTLIKVVAVGIVVICIVYKILGREGGEAS